MHLILHGVNFTPLIEELYGALDTLFEAEEVKNDLFTMHPSKAPVHIIFMQHFIKKY